jgi:hypothetical protein
MRVYSYLACDLSVWSAGARTTLLLRMDTFKPVSSLQNIFTSCAMDDQPLLGKNGVGAVDFN